MCEPVSQWSSCKDMAAGQLRDLEEDDGGHWARYPRGHWTRSLEAIGQEASRPLGKKGLEAIGQESRRGHWTRKDIVDTDPRPTTGRVDVRQSRPLKTTRPESTVPRAYILGCIRSIARSFPCPHPYELRTTTITSRQGSMADGRSCAPLSRAPARRTPQSVTPPPCSVARPRALHHLVPAVMLVFAMPLQRAGQEVCTTVHILERGVGKQWDLSKTKTGPARRRRRRTRGGHASPCQRQQFMRVHRRLTAPPDGRPACIPARTRMSVLSPCCLYGCLFAQTYCWADSPRGGL